MKIEPIAPPDGRKKNTRKESAEGEQLLAALAEESALAVLAETNDISEKPRELWTLIELLNDNQRLNAEIGRLKEQSRNKANNAFGQDYARMYATMGTGPCFSPWGPASVAETGFQEACSPMSSMSDYSYSSAFTGSGFTGPTSMMMRNIPNNYTRAKLLDLLHKEGFAGTFDFFYLPIDLKKKNGLGYAFINFINHEIAAHFRQKFDGFSSWIATSGKVCQVTFSDRIQGLDAHVERYRNSAIMHPTVPEEFKPMWFQNGVPMPFPPPTKTVPAPQER